MPNDPLSALVYNNESYGEFPLPVQTRRQLSGAMSAAIAVHMDKMHIDPGTADWIWQVGLTASPWDTSILLARAQYLMVSGRLDEMPPVIARLLKTAPRTAKVYIPLAIYREATGDIPGALEAARQGMAAPYIEPMDRATFLGVIERNPLK